MEKGRKRCREECKEMGGRNGGKTERRQIES